MASVKTGNALVQARAAGVVGPGLADPRDLVRRTQAVVTLEPEPVDGRVR